MAFVHNVLAQAPGTEVVTTFSLARKLEANTKETTPRFPRLAQPPASLIISWSFQVFLRNTAVELEGWGSHTPRIPRKK